MNDELEKIKVVDCVENMTYANRIMSDDSVALMDTDHLPPSIKRNAPLKSIQFDQSNQNALWIDPEWIARLDEMEKLSGLGKTCRKRYRIVSRCAPDGWLKKTVDSQLGDAKNAQ